MCLSAHQRVGRILYLPVGGAVDVVHQEAQYLLEGDVDGAECQPLFLTVVERVFHLAEIASHVCLEAADVHAYARQVFVVLSTGVGIAAQGITHVVERCRRHARVKVYHTEYVTLLVEEHVRELRVVVSHSHRQAAVFHHLPEVQHLLSTVLHPFNLLLHGFHQSELIATQRVVPLFVAETDVVETLDGLVQRIGIVCKHLLEASYALSALETKFQRGGVVYRDGIFDKHTHRPVVGFIVVVWQAFLGKHHRQRLTHGVSSCLDNLRLHVCGNLHDVVHHAGHVGEDDVVFPLQDIVWSRTLRLQDEGIVDEALAQRLDAHHLALKGKLFCYVIYFHNLLCFVLSITHRKSAPSPCPSRHE